MQTVGGTNGEVRSLWCNYCKRRTLHSSLFMVAGCLFTFCTCGLALPLWIVGYYTVPHFVCEQCGTKRKVK